MGSEQIRRWESGALAHAVTDPFGQGPVPWLRGGETYFDDSGQVVPWYTEPAPESVAPGPAARKAGSRVPAPRRAGTAGGAGLRSADDVHQQIKGFVSTGAVAPGEALDLHVTVNPPQEFTVDVYRIGHYGGDGAAKITTSPRLSGIVQPPPLAADRTVSCHHWWLSWRLQIPSYWSIGAHVAVLTTADGRHRSHIPFTIRDNRSADLLLLLPDITWQAYNLYPEDGRTGASLYHAWDDSGRLLGEADAATTVSFDRPYAGAGLPLHVGHAYDFIRWAERYGYDVAYADARDLHGGHVDPTRYRGLVFPGHDEYWSTVMRRTVERARDHGTSLVFLSANTLYWQVELAPSPSGAPDRLLTCRKRRGPGKPVLWREVDRPEQQLVGIQYLGRVPEPHPLIVRNAGHWLWDATGAREGDALDGLVAGEADRYFPRAPLPGHDERVLLAHSPYTDVQGALRHQETSLYRAPSGAWVFASGTFAWSPALDRPGHVDARVQRATANLLDRICKRD
ncbi:MULTISPECIES: N,N-dimethylformamidase beta subunit family domain-containing protein [unclassified Streptomyces]|uniref:N,N-dimethylformamidase beta subunit family domain-containing protein n=1 Tax=unclassified Streptomyces TaxID=2593676 RepID=UPI001F0484FE|nr:MULTISPECIES: N,N-dimethylformamidase beta subunit family domain-containing protein [unclassified Streptomyces]MCH0566195.1 phosphoribosylamine--glycine ligase [Streptomyces sp. MUM 2J]MCH0572025.1 phosphoribosylamine--glycine ligase [Streptomyces sp. MUM 136J]